jgi:glucose-6-phosphate 1-epimerase
MEIEIYSSSLKAIISREGAWLTNLSDDNGDILFPKRKLKAPDGSSKARGGCHVCLPNFGPGGDSGLAQHGFGRTSVWEVGEQNENSASFLLKGGAEGYEGLEARLTYTVDNALTMKLELTNTGHAPLRVAPGFHPYFILQPGEGQVMVEDTKHDLDDLADTLYEDGQSKKLITTNRTINLTSENLPTWAIWTDQLSNYVCVEPTHAGNAFLNDKPAENELLQPGQSETYSCIITG